MLKLISAFCIYFAVSGSIQAQTKLVLKDTLLSYTIKNETLERAMQIWKINYGIDFYFTGADEFVPLASLVNCSIINLSPEPALRKTLKGQYLTYNIENSKKVKIRPLDIEIYTFDEEGNPLPGVTVMIKGTHLSKATDSTGKLVIPYTVYNKYEATLSFSYVGRDSLERTIAGRTKVIVVLRKMSTELGQSTIYTGTGYSNYRRDRVTGSFESIPVKWLHKPSSTFIGSLIAATGNGILCWNDPYNANRQRFSIRGLSTLYGNPNPLIVIDDMPYEGDPATILLNPALVNNITLLKDAPAASIWGARAGNGVLVITTLKGNTSTGNGIHINNNISIGNKPDLHYLPVMRARDIIDYEESLFNNGTYRLLKNPAQVVSPVIETLVKKQKGLISASEADDIINRYKEYDNRKDLNKYFYRNPVNQQYALSMNGSSGNQAYLISVGIDRNLNSLQNSDYKRNTFYANYQLQPVKGLKAGTSIQYLESDTHNNDQAPYIPWTFVPLVDENGHALVVPTDLRQTYKDTAGKGILLDWNNRPYDELKMRQNNIQLTNIRIDAGLQYKITNNLQAKLLYQYTKDNSAQRNYMSTETYFFRNLYNCYTERTSGGIKRHVPRGGILDHSDSKYFSKNIRFQADFNPTWGKHELTATAGIEQRIAEATKTGGRDFGYDPDRSGSTFVDLTKTYPLFYNPVQTREIETTNLQPFNLKDNYGSVFFTTLYTYNKRYSLSVSARKDESNLFGDSAKKSLPLWSAGGAWIILNDNAYRLSLLKVRGAFGYSGNVIKSVPTVTTLAGGNLNIYNSPSNWINTPPHPNLKWEQVQMMNIGVDFIIGNQRVNGSIEYYRKRSGDLLASAPGDSGILTTAGNVAAMTGSGIDITLNTRNIITKHFTWQTRLSASYNRTVVTKYPDTAVATWMYVNPQTRIPLQGYHPLGVFSLRSMGLDPANGDPQGLLHGQVSKNYDSLLYNTPLNELVYHGPEQPVFYGSMYNNLTWKGFNASFAITWKAGHYFRRNSIFYTDILNGRNQGHPDYEKRWQQPGDESITRVPSMKNLSISRDNFYKYSSDLVEKADHIRLQFAELGYTFSKQYFKRLPFKEARLYIQATNLGILWRATKTGIDPDFVLNIPTPRTWTIGFSVDLEKNKKETNEK